MKTSIPSHWDLLLLATATVKSIKRCHTITELVVVWSVCSVCTSVAKSKVDGPHIQLDTLQRFTLFVLAVARSSKTSVHFLGIAQQVLHSRGSQNRGDNRESWWTNG